MLCIKAIRFISGIMFAHIERGTGLSNDTQIPDTGQGILRATGKHRLAGMDNKSENYSWD
jgi:hypothetical protein